MYAEFSGFLSVFPSYLTVIVNCCIIISILLGLRRASWNKSVCSAMFHTDVGVTYSCLIAMIPCVSAK